ncbi:MAG: hypothetical protein AB1403_25990, partial [Candidatus Riflebacteria bacterium]
SRLDNRRRLLRNTEVQQIFPQLVDSYKGKPRPLGYDAKWLHYSKPVEDGKILDWLKGFSLVSNPFGVLELKNYPFYPEGSTNPDKWNDFLDPIPQLAQCPTPEDARALAYRLRAECLPVKKIGTEGKERFESWHYVFPVLVSFNQTLSIESPLLTITRSTAQAWLDILCLSPDAMLDLPLVEQEALLELLCWAFNSAAIVTHLLKQSGLESNTSSDLLSQKIGQFKSELTSAQLPQDAILLSWLKIRPPDLNFTYLTILFDEIPVAVKIWWLEQYSPLLSTLFLNGIITKIVSSSQGSVTFPLSVIELRLRWADSKLKESLNSQFAAAMDKAEQKEMGQDIDFRSLFGSHPAVGYLKDEKDTTDKLIAASNKSLARMLMLGNRLLQYHCDN